MAATVDDVEKEELVDGKGEKGRETEGEGRRRVVGLSEILAKEDRSDCMTRVEIL